MYNRGLRGWMKHFDFMILDFIIIELTFILACNIRHPMRHLNNLEEYRRIMFVLGAACIMGSMLMRMRLTAKLNSPSSTK